MVSDDEPLIIPFSVNRPVLFQIIDTATEAGLLGKALHGGAHAAVKGSQVARVYRRTVEGAGALTVPMLEQCIINDKKLATADKKLGADTKKLTAMKSEIDQLQGDLDSQAQTLDRTSQPLMPTTIRLTNIRRKWGCIIGFWTASKRSLPTIRPWMVNFPNNAPDKNTMMMTIRAR